MRWYWSHDNNVWRKNRDAAREILLFTFISRRQQHFRFIHIFESIIKFTHLREWDEVSNQMSKSKQSIRCLWNLKQSTSSRFRRTDLSADEFIQRMRNTQISFEAVQKDSNNSVMQIKEKWLYWLKDILTHCFA